MKTNRKKLTSYSFETETEDERLAVLLATMEDLRDELNSGASDVLVLTINRRATLLTALERTANLMSLGLAADTERLDFIEKICYRDAKYAPVGIRKSGRLTIRVFDGKAIIWDHYSGLVKMGEGANLREAIDDAIGRLNVKNEEKHD